MFKQVDPKKFIQARNKISEGLKLFLTDYSAEDYIELNATCYLSEDEKSGYVLTGKNDLISVFSLNKQGKAAVKSAIDNGALTLDCIGEFLAQYYSKFGFVETDRVTWDDQYAPENWDYDEFGRPDIIFMKLKE